MASSNNFKMQRTRCQSAHPTHKTRNRTEKQVNMSSSTFVLQVQGKNISNKNISSKQQSMEAGQKINRSLHGSPEVIGIEQRDSSVEAQATAP